MSRTVAFADAYPQLQGGAQELTRRLARSLAERGDDVRLIVPGLGATTSRAAAEGTRVVIVPGGPWLGHYGGTTRGVNLAAAMLALPGFWWRVRRALADIDILHANGQRGMVLFAIPARSRGIPVVYHRHSWPLSQRLDGWLLRLASEVIVPSRLLGKDVETHASTPWTQVVGMVTEHTSEPARSRTPRLATVGRLHHQKGLDVLLEALALLQGDRPTVTLDVIGEADPTRPQYRAWLIERAAELGVADHVVFHGHLQDPWAVAGTCHVYVQPSRTESQGLSLWQAVATGVPVVASDIPAFREVVTDGVSGRLVRPECPEQLAAAIAELLDDAHLARAMSASAQAAIPSASETTMVEGVLAVHDRVSGR